MKKTAIVKKVLVFGTFDGIHEGHISYLKQAAKLGKLIVSVASNDVVKEVKGKIPKDESERKLDVEKLGISEKVIIGDRKTKTWSTIREVMPDIIALGYDQEKFEMALKENYKEIGVKFKIVKLKSFEPEKYHSSLLNKITK